jgi:hypothetical protein
VFFLARLACASPAWRCVANRRPQASEHTSRPLTPAQALATGRALAPSRLPPAPPNKRANPQTSTAAGAGALLATGLDEVAWLLNLRGSDVDYNPGGRSRAVPIHAAERATSRLPGSVSPTRLRVGGGKGVRGPFSRACPLRLAPTSCPQHPRPSVSVCFVCDGDRGGRAPLHRPPKGRGGGGRAPSGGGRGGEGSGLGRGRRRGVWSGLAWLAFVWLGLRWGLWWGA